MIFSVSDLLARCGHAPRAAVRHSARAAMAAGIAFYALAAGASDWCPTQSLYILSQELPATFCLEKGKEPCTAEAGPHGWIVHGLWLDDASSRRHIDDCKGSKFSDQEIGDLMPKLTASWPDLLTGQDGDDADSSKVDWLWRHEWDKHGTCFMACDSGVSSEHDYFSLALDLASQHDVGRILQQAGIEPDNSQKVASQTIFDAIQSATGVSPVVDCYKDSDGGDYLYQVLLCAQPGGELVDCPADMASKHSACAADVIYPAPPG